MTVSSDSSECYPWSSYLPGRKGLHSKDRGKLAHRISVFFRGKKYQGFYIVHQDEFRLYGLDCPVEHTLAIFPFYTRDDVHQSACESFEIEVQLWKEGYCYEHLMRPDLAKRRGQMCCVLASRGKRRNRRKWGYELRQGYLPQHLQ